MTVLLLDVRAMALYCRLSSLFSAGLSSAAHYRNAANITATSPENRGFFLFNFGLPAIAILVPAGCDPARLL